MIVSTSCCWDSVLQQDEYKLWCYCRVPSLNLKPELQYMHVLEWPSQNLLKTQLSFSDKLFFTCNWKSKPHRLDYLWKGTTDTTSSWILKIMSPVKSSFWMFKGTRPEYLVYYIHLNLRKLCMCCYGKAKSCKKKKKVLCFSANRDWL